MQNTHMRNEIVQNGGSKKQTEVRLAYTHVVGSTVLHLAKHTYIFSVHRFCLWMHVSNGLMLK